MGTVINCLGIIAGGILGMLCGSHFSKGMQDTLMKADGAAVLFIGIAGALSRMFVIQDGMISTQGSMMMILSLALGAVIGELLDLSGKLEKFGTWLKVKSGNAKDAQFVNAFVDASLTVCIGAMAVVGAIEDGVDHDVSILASKAVLDFIIILCMSASMGKGCLFSFIPVGIFQGVITLLAAMLASGVSDAAMNNLSLVGSVLIFCVGVNLIFGRKINVANLLPSLVFAVLFSFLNFTL